MINKKLKTKAATIAIAAALALTGTVPSFAGEKTFEGAPEPPQTDSTSVMLMDAGSGDVLYEKNADEKRDPASTTKILNLLVCLDTLDFDQEVTIEKEPQSEGSTMKLKKGETLTVKDLVYGMMLWSANDAAEYLGYLAGNGDVDAFCDMMNAKAKKIGATDTDYVNPNGLNNEAVNNITTARDLALMTKEAMKDKRFREIVGSRQYTIPATNKYKERKLRNSNLCFWNDQIKAAAEGDAQALDKYTKQYRNDPNNYISEDADEALVRQLAKEDAQDRVELMYKPCIGVKTGYSSTAGDCFVGFAKKGNTEIIAVVLNAPHTKNKFQDAKKLWVYAYKNFKSYTVASANDVQYSQKVKRGTLRKVDLGLTEDFKVTVRKSAKPSETVTTQLELPEEKPMAPIKKGTVLGQMVAYDDGEEIARADLITLEEVGEGGPLSYIGIADESVPEFIILLVLILITLFILLVVVRASIRNKRRRERRRQRRMQDSNGDTGKY